MTAALVAVMVVLFELVHKDAREPQDPAPGDFVIELLYVEEPIRQSERASFGVPNLSGTGSMRGISLPFEEFVADGTRGAAASSEVTCRLAGEPGTGARVTYEGTQTNNSPVSDGTPLTITLEIARTGIQLPPFETEFDDSDVSEAAFLANLGSSLPAGIAALLPGIASDRFHNGHLDIVRRHDAGPAVYKFDWPTSPALQASWNTPRPASEDLGGTNSRVYADLSARIEERLLRAAADGDWLRHSSDPWILAGFLPFRPHAHLTCRGSGEAIGFDTAISLSVRPNCPAGCSDDIRPMHLIAVRLLASTMEAPKIWTALDTDDPPFAEDPEPPTGTSGSLDTSGPVPRLVQSTTLILRFE